MRIVVTGATGFLGSYVVADLAGRGHDLAVVVRPQSDPWRLHDLLSRLHVIEGTLADMPALRAPLRDFKPDAVVHLGWAGVAGADRNAAEQAANVAMTVELVTLAAEAGASTFVGAGSQAEYGPYSRAIRENDATAPTTGYGRAKLDAGQRADAAAAKHGMRFAWLRIFSTYGPKDNAGWLIPSAIQRLRRDKRMELTACEQRWGFLHVSDAAAAFATVIEDGTARGTFNLGSPDAPLLRDTMTRLRDLVDPRAELAFGAIPYRPDQVMHLEADIARLNAIGWTPRVDLERGLRETVEWYVRDQAA